MTYNVETQFRQSGETEVRSESESFTGEIETGWFRNKKGIDIRHYLDLFIDTIVMNGAEDIKIFITKK